MSFIKTAKASFLKFYCRNDVILLALFYTIAHGGLLFIPNAIFWDDWTLFHSDHATFLARGREIGFMFNLIAYFLVGMIDMGPWIFRSLTFALMFGSGLLLNSILAHHKFLNMNSRFFIVLLFLILPFNIARASLIILPYTTCYFLFFLGWYFLYKNKLISIICFFVSFNTNSLLLFFALPLIDLFYKNRAFASTKNFIKFTKDNFFLIILPVCFYIIKTQFYPPSGVYKNYNESLTLENLIWSAKTQYWDFRSQWHEFIRSKISVACTILLAIPSYVLLRKFTFREVKSNKQTILLIGFGILAFLLGAIPYWIVGGPPKFYEWVTRHQLLLPLGSSLILFGMSSLIGRVQIIFLSMVVGLSLTYNIANYLDFFADWKKQEAIISLLKNDDVVAASSLVAFNDNTTHSNAIKRTFRFYEWSGILEAAYGDQKRLGVNYGNGKLDDYPKGELDKYTHSPFYKSSQFEPPKNNKVAVVTVHYAEPPDMLFPRKIWINLFPKILIETRLEDIARAKN